MFGCGPKITNPVWSVWHSTPIPEESADPSPESELIGFGLLKFFDLPLVFEILVGIMCLDLVGAWLVFLHTAPDFEET